MGRAGHFQVDLAMTVVLKTQKKATQGSCKSLNLSSGLQTYKIGILLSLLPLEKKKSMFLLIQ